MRGSLFPAGMEGPSSSKRSVCHLYRDLGMRKLIDQGESSLMGEVSGISGYIKGL